MIKGLDLIKDCEPKIKEIAGYLGEKYNITITDGKRSLADHQAIYKKLYGANWQKYIPMNSMHLLGKAFDLVVENKNPVEWISDVLAKFPEIRGVGINVFLKYAHLDIRPSKDLVVWVYDAQNREVK